MSNEPTPLPWVIFRKADRAQSGIIRAVAFKTALQVAADRTGRPVDEFDYSPVYEGETHEQAKARVAAGAR